MRFSTLVSAVFVLTTSTAAVADDDLLRVLVYNIHHGQGLDGKLDLERIANVISEAKPDLVALQEVDFKTRRSQGIDQAARLGELCEMHSAFGRAIDNQGGQYGNAVLSVKPILATKNHRLPRAGGAENRFVIAATVPLIRRQQVVFASTHFDHRGTPAREEASKTVVKLFSQSSDFVILAGDLNCEPDAPELRPLLSMLLPVNSDPVATFPASHPTKQIDYIFYDKRALWRIASVQVIDDGGASDHRPMLAVIRVRP